MKKSNTTTVIAVVIGLALIAAVTITTQMAYAQLTVENEAEAENEDNDSRAVGPSHDRTIQSAEPSEGAAHTGTISKSLTVQFGELREGDEPAHRGEISLKLPNDTIKERVIESAPQSSNAAAAGQGGQDILTHDFGDVDP